MTTIYSGVIALGDSTTYGYSDGVQVTNTMPKATQDRLLSQYDISSAITNLGTNGTAVRDLLGSGLIDSTADLISALTGAEELVLLNYGINEAYRNNPTFTSDYTVAQFKIDLTNVVMQLKAAGKTVIIQSANKVRQVGASADYWSAVRDWSSTVENYADAAVEVAGITGSILHDKFLDSIWNNNNAWPVADSLNPTEASYIALGNVLADIIFASVYDLVQARDYNDVRTIIEQILNGTIDGYGTNLLEATTATSSMIASSAHFASLYRDVNKSIKHQTGQNISGISSPTTSDIITKSFLDVLATSATIAVLNSATVHPSQIDFILSSTNIVNGPWSSSIRYDRNYAWLNSSANYFFNLGGYIVNELNYSGTVSSIQDQAFVNFINLVNNDTACRIDDPYDKSIWRGPWTTTATSYSTSTSAGIFTATVIYIRNSQGVNSSATIVPPAGVGSISIIPVSNAKLYYSTDAIKSPLPDISVDTKILTLSIPDPVFNFRAGTRSNPQTVTISNVGAETVTVNAVSASSNGVDAYFIKTATNLTQEIPVVEPITVPFTIASGASYLATLFYSQPVKATTEIGTYYNNVTIFSDADAGGISLPTTQIVISPEYSFTVDLINTLDEYTYDDWATEYSLSNAQKTLGINIANTYYLPNSDFGLIDGIQRYGLFRNPDALGLKNWVDYTNNYLSGNWLALASVFFAAVDVSTFDSPRSLSPNKAFASGYGYGDFYDKTKPPSNVIGNGLRFYQYIIREQFGSSTGSNFVLYDQRFNGSPDAEAVAAFSVSGNQLTGPAITFNPIVINNTGTYSTKLDATLYAKDVSGIDTVATQTVTLSLVVSELVDGNLVKWVSGYEEDNGVMGLSYDRINGKLHLTVGFGSGGDGAPELSSVNYIDSYVNVDNLSGLTGDSLWGTFDSDYGLPMYKTTFGAPWGAFMQTYAVWPANPTITGTISYPLGLPLTTKYKFVASAAGTYTIDFSADNNGSVLIDGVPVVSGVGFSSVGPSQSVPVVLSQGEHVITLVISNDYLAGINPAGIAVRILNPVSNIIWSTLNTVRSSLPYLYWREVYRIPIDPQVAKIYYLNNYLVKNTFPVNEYPTGYFKYGDYFGSDDTPSTRSIMTLSSDGNGNIDFIYNPVTKTPTEENTGRTINNIRFLPFYYSFYSSRKKNYPGAIASRTTQKLIGINTIGVVTANVDTPGYTLPEESLTVTAPGVPDPGTSRGPSPVPGRQYNVSETSYVESGAWAPISRHWIANETGGREYSWSRALVFKHPNSTISNSELEEWGFDAGDVIAARDIILYRVQTTCDYYVGWGYSIMDKGMTSIVDARDNLELINVIHVPGGRGTYDQYPNVQISDPGINEIIYFWINDNQATAARGSNNNSITVKYKRVL
jgi:lysophospholipase L1-like esterase